MMELAESTEPSARLGIESLLCLLKQDSPSEIYRHVWSVIQGWNTRPVQYANHLAPLNALVRLGLEEPDVLRRMGVALGFEEEEEEEEEDRQATVRERRNEYQQAYMRARRDRLAKALTILEARTSTPSVADRVDVERLIKEKWRKDKLSYLSTLGDLSWRERNRATAAFWRQIDQDLDKQLSELADRPDANEATLDPENVHLPLAEQSTSDVEREEACADQPMTATGGGQVKELDTQEFFSALLGLCEVELWEAAEIMNVRRASLEAWVRKDIKGGRAISDKVTEFVDRLAIAHSERKLPIKKVYDYRSRMVNLHRLLGV